VGCVRGRGCGVLTVEVVMAKDLRSKKLTSTTPNGIAYMCGSAWMQFTRASNRVWLDAHGSLVFNARQCRTLAEWLNERADEMEAE
jgi:hypothetical protein